MVGGSPIDNESVGKLCRNKLRGANFKPVLS